MTDAYRNIWVDDYGYEYCYHIPRINLSSCAAVNEEIYRTLFQIYYQDVEESINEYGDPNLSSINYIWNHADGVISILVSMPSNYADWTDHMIYYVSARTGERLEAAHLLEVFGVSDRDFRDRVYSALDACWQGILASWSEEDNEVLLDMSQNLIEQTLADEISRPPSPSSVPTATCPSWPASSSPPAAEKSGVCLTWTPAQSWSIWSAPWTTAPRSTPDSCIFFGPAANAAGPFFMPPEGSGRTRTGPR